MSTSCNPLSREGSAVGISELVERSGVPLATVKYYIRSRLLMPGESTSATRSVYTEAHLRRLALIRALTDVAGLSVQKAGVVIGLIDNPQTNIFESLGKAVAALPPYPHARESPDAALEYPRARALLQRVGQRYDPHFAAVAQLERALAAAEAAGLPMSDDRARRYAEHIMAIARVELAGMPNDSVQNAIEYAVLGTSLYEPVILAMRRLAHQDLAAQMFADDDENT